MQPHEVQVGQELVVGDVRIAVLDLDDDRVLLRITAHGAAHMACVLIPPGAEQLDLQGGGELL
jgi:hypothetical protein